MDAMAEIDYQLNRLTLIEKLTIEDVKGIDSYVYINLVRHNIQNLHNLEVLLKGCNNHCLAFLIAVSDQLEVDVLLLFLRYCDDLSSYIRFLNTCVRLAIKHSKHDVLEVLLEKISHLITATDLREFIETSIWEDDVVALRICLRYLQFEESKEIINSEEISVALSTSSVAVFDELFLVGFNVFLPHNNKTFTVQLFRMNNHHILTRLHGLNAISDEDLSRIPKSDRRHHYYTILRINKNVNELDKKEDDQFLRRFISVQKNPLTAARALSRELRLYNRCVVKQLIPYHTEAYLDSLRPECNRELAQQLIEDRKKRDKRVFLPIVK